MVTRMLRQALSELVGKLSIGHVKRSGLVDARGMPVLPVRLPAAGVHQVGNLLFTTFETADCGAQGVRHSATLGVEVRDYEGPTE